MFNFVQRVARSPISAVPGNTTPNTPGLQAQWKSFMEHIEAAEPAATASSTVLPSIRTHSRQELVQEAKPHQGQTEHASSDTAAQSRIPVPKVRNRHVQRAFEDPELLDAMTSEPIQDTLQRYLPQSKHGGSSKQSAAGKKSTTAKSTPRRPAASRPQPTAPATDESNASSNIPRPSKSSSRGSKRSTARVASTAAPKAADSTSGGPAAAEGEGTAKPPTDPKVAAGITSIDTLESQLVALDLKATALEDGRREVQWLLAEADAAMEERDRRTQEVRQRREVQTGGKLGTRRDDAGGSGDGEEGTETAAGRSRKHRGGRMAEKAGKLEVLDEQPEEVVQAETVDHEGFSRPLLKKAPALAVAGGGGGRAGGAFAAEMQRRERLAAVERNLVRGTIAESARAALETGDGAMFDPGRQVFSTSQPEGGAMRKLDLQSGLAKGIRRLAGHAKGASGDERGESSRTDGVDTRASDHPNSPRSVSGDTVFSSVSRANRHKQEKRDFLQRNQELAAKAKRGLITGLTEDEESRLNLIMVDVPEWFDDAPSGSTASTAANGSDDKIASMVASLPPDGSDDTQPVDVRSVLSGATHLTRAMMSRLTSDQRRQFSEEVTNDMDSAFTPEIGEVQRLAQIERQLETMVSSGEASDAASAPQARALKLIPVFLTSLHYDDGVDVPSSGKRGGEWQLDDIEEGSEGSEEDESLTMGGTRKTKSGATAVAASARPPRPGADAAAASKRAKAKAAAAASHLAQQRAERESKQRLALIDAALNALSQLPNRPVADGPQARMHYEGHLGRQHSSNESEASRVLGHEVGGGVSARELEDGPNTGRHSSRSLGIKRQGSKTGSVRGTDPRPGTAAAQSVAHSTKSGRVSIDGMTVASVASSARPVSHRDIATESARTASIAASIQPASRQAIDDLVAGLRAQFPMDFELASKEPRGLLRLHSPITANSSGGGGGGGGSGSSPDDAVDTEQQGQQAARDEVAGAGASKPSAAQAAAAADGSDSATRRKTKPAPARSRLDNRVKLPESVPEPVREKHVSLFSNPFAAIAPVTTLPTAADKRVGKGKRVTQKPRPPWHEPAAVQQTPSTSSADDKQSVTSSPTAAHQADSLTAPAPAIASQSSSSPSPAEAPAPALRPSPPSVAPSAPRPAKPSRDQHLTSAPASVSITAAVAQSVDFNSSIRSVDGVGDDSVLVTDSVDMSAQPQDNSRYSPIAASAAAEDSTLASRPSMASLQKWAIKSERPAILEARRNLQDAIALREEMMSVYESLQK